MLLVPLVVANESFTLHGDVSDRVRYSAGILGKVPVIPGASTAHAKPKIGSRSKGRDFHRLNIGHRDANCKIARIAHAATWPTRQLAESKRQMRISVGWRRIMTRAHSPPTWTPPTASPDIGRQRWSPSAPHASYWRASLRGGPRRGSHRPKQP